MIMSVTKAVEIGRPAAESYDFIVDPRTMPRWAIHNVKAIRKLAALKACREDAK
jgi:hypothetical protein